MSAGCYIGRQGLGQADILLNRRPIEEVLLDPSVPRPDRRQLRILGEAHRFGLRRLGLAGEGLYGTWYDTGDDPVAWNVSACPKDRFEARTWWFPVVGEVPYLGFFDRRDAVETADRLRQDEDLDVLVRGVGAYSTLGWFDDPVFRSALGGDAIDVATLVLHEMAHATVFFPGHVEWNENFATLVGHRGAIEFLIDRYGPVAPEVDEARARQREDRRLGDHLDAVFAELRALYGTPDLSRAEKLRRREEIFARGKANLPEGAPGTRRWRARTWNNALFMSRSRYRGRQDDLGELLDGRFDGDLRAFVEWLGTLAEPP